MTIKPMPDDMVMSWSIHEWEMLDQIAFEKDPIWNRVTTICRQLNVGEPDRLHFLCGALLNSRAKLLLQLEDAAQRLAPAQIVLPAGHPGLAGIQPPENGS